MEEKKKLIALLGETFFLLKKGALKLFLATLAAVFLFGLGALCIFIMLFGFRFLMGAGLLPALLTGLSIIAVIVLAVIVVPLYQIVIFRILQAVDKNEPLGIKDAYRAAYAVLGSYLFVSLLLMVKVILWSFLLIVPGIIFGVLYSFAPLAFLIDGKKGQEALVFSKAIIKPNAWKYIGYYAVAVLGVIFVGVFISLLFQFLFGLFTHIALDEKALGKIFDFILHVFFSGFSYVLYKEWRRQSPAMQGKVQ